MKASLKTNLGEILIEVNGQSVKLYKDDLKIELEIEKTSMVDLINVLRTQETQEILKYFQEN